MLQLRTPPSGRGIARRATVGNTSNNGGGCCAPSPRLITSNGGMPSGDAVGRRFTAAVATVDATCENSGLCSSDGTCTMALQLPL